MKKVKKMMLGILAVAALATTGCGNHTDMAAVVVVAGEDSAGASSKAVEIEKKVEAVLGVEETTEPIRIQLATEAVKETAEPETTAPREPEVEDITLLFAGDVYLSQHVLNAYDNAGGIHGVLDEGIRAEIDAADIFMVNQEFPFIQ